MPDLRAVVLASKSKRIGELEHLLRETKLTASHEFERLKAENERMQQSYQSKLKEKERECKKNWEEGGGREEGGEEREGEGGEGRRGRGRGVQ